MIYPTKTLKLENGTVGELLIYKCKLIIAIIITITLTSTSGWNEETFFCQIAKCDMNKYVTAFAAY